METINNSERIIASVSLFAFAQQHGGDIAVGTCTASDGTSFPEISFSNGREVTYVDFGKSLEGGLTFEEICAQANNLQVVQLTVDPEVLERRRANKKQLETYKLCKKSENNWKGGNIFAVLGMNA